ncbi:hypothetical protein L226DRAFT_366758 [Lentinus tigrinus ALCF2SS1-7]|uniref:uncharacterized protein n=1 Tax=Lentinus tigrinus ALCF2SS1-7 TaxID=1328758 RepID=UPI0011661A6A|nr:hypothetical protein L226DRAFT_366758 [Lentinus tigrinus ALCF2SS1-7]
MTLSNRTSRASPGTLRQGADQAPFRAQLQPRRAHQRLSLLEEPPALVRGRCRDRCGSSQDALVADFAGIDAYKKKMNSVIAAIQGSG